MQALTIEGFRLSPQQEHLWLQQADNQSVYQSNCTILITGNIEIKNLELALQNIVNRHEILRTSFYCLPGMTIPVQVITNKQVSLDQVYNLNNLPIDEQETKTEEIIQKLNSLPFDLEKGTILKTALITLSPEKQLLYLSLPAICSDTTTLYNLIQELASLYSDKLKQELSADPLQYADFSEWQNQILETEETAIGRKFWLQQNLSFIDNLKLPYEINPRQDNHRNNCFIPKVINSNIDAKLTHTIETLAQKFNISSDIFLLTCWQILLWKLLDQSEIMVGVGINGRKYDELTNALGLFAKYLPLHCHLDSNLTFSQVLQQVNDSVEEINKWQECFTWEQVTKSGNKLTNLPFGFDFKSQAPVCYANGVNFSITKQSSYIEYFKVRLCCHQQNDNLDLEFHYDSNLFDTQSIELLADQFSQLLTSVINNSEGVISKLNILSENAIYQLIYEFNQTQVDYPQNKCIYQLFTEQVERTPNHTAVVYGHQHLTYAQLNAHANQLAHYLQKLGVGAEVLVGLCVERSLEMLIGILGILKAGGAYVPLDPHYPQERLAFMLKDTQVNLLLTQQHLLTNLPSNHTQTICLDTDWQTISSESTANPITNTSAENLVYVIYTSGSTGTPKGVEITHRNLVHSTTARICYYQEPISNFLLLSSFAFDSSVAGIFWTLCSGGTLHLPAEGIQREVNQLGKLISQYRISHLLSLPSLYSLILQQAKSEELVSLRTVIVAGEVCSSELVKYHFQLQPYTSLFNEYGPTEVTVWSSVYNCQTSEIGTQVSIGRPIANTQIYILDSDLQPVPMGVSGEIYISGEGLARGYLHQPTITSEKFLLHPFSQKPGMRIYKTGDLGRYLSDGNIEFLGRIDNQVKIRGFRIELGEIEALLNQHPEVQASVVIAREDIPGNKRLVAYVVLQVKSSLISDELREFLQLKLPDFMIPSTVVVLKEFPLSPNGKVDRKALPAPEEVRSRGNFVAPRTDVEEILTQIWAEILQVEKIGIYDNFFELGGHSLLTTQLLAKVKETFNLDISLRSLLEQPTVEGLAKNIDKVCQIKVNHSTLNLQAETVLDASIYPQIAGSFVTQPHAILLTGSTGFLGAFLLVELLQQTTADIYCLLRSQDVESGKNKLQNKLKEYKIWNESYSSRIIPVTGDLSQPLLGLDGEKFQYLAEKIDVIYHNGAWVHHIYPYSVLKSANVLGTQEILRLASQDKTKPVHFISSSGVVAAAGFSGVKVVSEQDSLNENEFPSNGYCQTKWVAEKLVQTGAERGIPISIYRPSRISGHSQTGVFNSHDFLYKLIIGCVKLGSAPDIDIRENIVPVDYVSKAIVHLSKQEESLGKTFHLVHSQTLHSNLLIDFIRYLGYEIELISYNQWREKLLNITQGSFEHPLYSLVPFFPDRQTQTENSGSGFLKFDHQNVINGLVDTSMSCPLIDNQLLSVYFSYLIDKGYLDNKL